MKKIHILSAFLLAGALCFSSCSKTGPAGPQGEQGLKGDQGPAGPQGLPGANGSTIYSGDGAPSADIGQNGDYYIDKTVGDLYGPKADAGWGDPLSLKGAKGDKGDQGAKGDKGNTGAKGDKGDPGQDGKDGSRILSGASAPASSAGNVGDYYWDTAGFMLYGPKTDAGWGSGVLLRGPKGDKGDKGDQGDPGTANVMYSDWHAFDWNSYATTTARLIIQDSLLTEDFMNKGGVVLVYVRVTLAPFGHNYFQLPSDFSGLFNCYMEFSIRTQGGYLIIDLHPVTSKTGSLTDQFEGDIDQYAFRYVLVPGGINIRRSSPPPDTRDYKATCRYYGIPE